MRLMDVNWQLIKQRPVTADNWPTWEQVTRKPVYVGRLEWFTFNHIPAGYFALDGSTIPNGINDFPDLANCGSAFITKSGNDLILNPITDFIRPMGNSGRWAGYAQGDAIRDITGGVFQGLHVQPLGAVWGTDGAFKTYRDTGNQGASGGVSSSATRIDFFASRVVPTANENRPRSTTALLCIYHGVI
ncbi:hypothetical protein GZ77_03510 [Endozoicomonas montiporae]|uniref:Phage tail collar domain-containing protein n=2 Tax=Endozoicomonas montiporae TaxID=1027273 RepID=A0A081NB38_9GAMM|nr:hypothetical protein [Endozoicomonas montiporae]AMO56630.1 phage variable tail fiber protein [Endozoicomonas montiporae CL-33]KEQ15661.1 hypothetical protein GZ77_03510 [Endozoicomonas montiporae]